MNRVIKRFKDGSFLRYGTGMFDDYCIFMVEPGGSEVAPRDEVYFQKLHVIGCWFGHNKVYSDFVKIYDLTTNVVDQSVLDYITDISKGYNFEGENEVLNMDKLFTILYMGMIAEECKENAILGKRIKRLGMHMTLMEHKKAGYAAHFMRGRSATDLDRLCIARGF